MARARVGHGMDVDQRCFGPSGDRALERSRWSERESNKSKLEQPTTMGRLEKSGAALHL